MLCCHCLEILNNFWTKGPVFLFCIGPYTYGWSCQPPCCKYGEARMGRNSGLPTAIWVSLEADPPASVEPWDNCNLTRDLEPEPAWSQASTLPAGPQKNREMEVFKDYLGNYKLLTSNCLPWACGQGLIHCLWMNRLHIFLTLGNLHKANTYTSK